MTSNRGLGDLEEDLELCVLHLKSTDNTETRLGDLFVGFILGRIYGEYQRCIREAMIQRANKSNDGRLVRYVELSTRRLGMAANALRRDIYDVFGNDLDKAQARVPKTAWITYNGLVALRNRVMHGEDVQKNLDGVVRMHLEARNVVYAIRIVLLGDREYSDNTDRLSISESWE